jgi:dipeptidyl aminopeptidase/acylaminoacyl peptidase
LHTSERRAAGSLHTALVCSALLTASPQALAAAPAEALPAVSAEAPAALSAEAPAALSAEAPAALSAYGHLPSLEDVAISPDGARFAFVKTRGDDRDLGIYEVGQASARGAARVGDTKLRSVDWLDADNLLITVSQTSAPPLGFTGETQEWFQLASYNVPKQKLMGVDFQVPDERVFNVVAGRPMIREVNGVTTLFIPGLYVSDRTLPGLFRYDVTRHTMRLIAKSSVPITHWLIDESGKIAAEFYYRDEQKAWTLYTRHDDRLTEVAAGHEAIDVPYIVGFNQSGDSLLVEFQEQGDRVCKPLVLKDATWGPPLGKGESFHRFITDRKSGRVIGGVHDLDDSKYVFFDNELQAHWNAAVRAFPGEHVHLVSASDDYSRMVLRVFGPLHGYVYAVFDWYTHRASIIGRIYEDVAVPAEVEAVSYPAADGLAIPGFLTLPPGREAQQLPLVVLPHGGPAAADTLGFDWWAQALASRGYAVLQPNYRGSALNPRFTAAGFGEWGRKMQTDLSDGVAYLAHRGIVDPKRVCIVGASYGGYAALAGATLQPDVYRCAVSVAGISDLGRMLRWTNVKAGHQDGVVERYWDRFMGASAPDDPRLAAISPIEHVGAVSGPILLIHGKDDTVVAYEQSEVMERALKRAGKPVEFVTLKREDHWLSRSATRLQMLEATVAFLRANNPPDL